LPDHPTGAQRASRRHRSSSVVIALLATLLAIGGSIVTAPQPVAAASRKVVIVVGPVGGETAHYKSLAKQVARQARSYGAKVVQISSPNATWKRVKDASRGANIFVYLGHGNGWPSPYAPFQTRTKNGLGLNKTYGRGNDNTEYFGEEFLASSIDLAPNAVVILMRLCYASGTPEWGRPSPSLEVAKRRVDNYGSGFLRTGARAVFAEGLGSARYILHGLFRTNRTMQEIFWTAPNARRAHASRYDPSRSPGWATAVLDPRRPGSYYRSFVGDLKMTAKEWR
jgi:hypothetical protein